jgi:hypothetical protein
LEVSKRTSTGRDLRTQVWYQSRETAIAVNVAEGFLAAACGEDELFARNFTLDEKGLNCCDAFKAGKDGKVFADHSDCLLK